MADDFEQGDHLANVNCTLSVNKSQRRDHSLNESHGEMDCCFMGLLLPVNSSTRHGQQCRNLTNARGPYLRAMLMVQVLNQWCRIQLMFDERPRCNRHCQELARYLINPHSTHFTKKTVTHRVKHVSPPHIASKWHSLYLNRQSFDVNSELFPLTTVPTSQHLDLEGGKHGHEASSHSSLARRPAPAFV